ncbi:MAG: HAD-IC family P-type ATPase [Bacteroidetes bacterium]|nr:HAD-IC family P-type ATPase [Bacteroidota bacterium]
MSVSVRASALPPSKPADQTLRGQACAHCGDPCDARPLLLEDKAFCCSGCRTAFQLIHELGLEDYYALNERPGAPVRQTAKDYSWMDDPVLGARLLRFRSSSRAVVQFRLPAIHCSSCVWLLERMPQFVPGVLEARVHFGRRELELHYHPEQLALSALAVQLQRIGYAPDINRADLDGKQKRNKSNDPLIKRLGVAGFCAGNIMLLSFPDYLDWDPASAGPMWDLVIWLKIGLSLPILFYSGSVYWKSAWLALRRGVPSVDIPIALGMAALTVRSFYDIIAGTGPGYLDSLAGLIFFLLIGRWFQDRIYGFLSFQRDYKSFFPAAVLKVEGQTRRPVVPDELLPGDVMFIRPGEIIPADGVLLGPARLDYHFITGESEPEILATSARVYGGARVLESPVEVQVEKALASSYLASLWDRDALRGQSQRQARMTRITDRFSRAFTPFVIALAALATAFWWPAGPARALEILTAVLIVACPCGLALAAPFALGHALRFLDGAGLHLRDTGALERLARLDTLVFDKTGTLTAPGQGLLRYEGRELKPDERAAVAAVAACSAHPLSVRIAGEWGDVLLPTASDVREEAGAGVSGSAGQYRVRIGSAVFAGYGSGRANSSAPHRDNPSARGVYLALNGDLPGRLVLEPALRSGARAALQGVMQARKGAVPRYSLELLSGDKAMEQEHMRALFPQGAVLRFGVSPFEKLERVEALQAEGHHVGMFGDGLNDAGALAAADVGLAVADDLSGYFPAADGVLHARSLGRLPALLSYGPLHARRRLDGHWGVHGLQCGGVVVCSLGVADAAGGGHSDAA